MNRSRVLRWCAHIFFAAALLWYGIEVSKLSCAIPPPYAWNQVERNLRPRNGHPRALAFFPTWQSRYASERGRFAEQEMVGWTEIRNRWILPYSEIRLVDVHGKFKRYRNQINSFYHILGEGPAGPMSVYRLILKEPWKGLLGLSLGNLPCRMRVFQDGLVAVPDRLLEPRLVRATFDAVPRKVMQLEVSRDRLYELRFNIPPKGARLHLIAGIDDQELYRKREDHAEIEVEVLRGGVSVDRYRIKNILKLRGHVTDLSNGSGDELSVQLRCVNGNMRKLSFLLFVTEN